MLAKGDSGRRGQGCSPFQFQHCAAGTGKRRPRHGGRPGSSVWLLAARQETSSAAGSSSSSNRKSQSNACKLQLPTPRPRAPPTRRVVKSTSRNHPRLPSLGDKDVLGLLIHAEIHIAEPEEVLSPRHERGKFVEAVTRPSHNLNIIQVHVQVVVIVHIDVSVKLQNASLVMQEERQAEVVDELVDPDRPDEPEPRRSKTSTLEEKEEGLPTVGSLPTSCVTPAVSPAALFMALRKIQVELASSEKLHVRHVNMSLWSTSSSLGYSMLLHSEQNRKVICSAGFLRSSETEAAGDDIVGRVDGW
ncbi:hypothetical protein CHGG_03517 [Chaetomium globosum CBS 148.51]|uniref:Uncharacterized protein n=1 Tax=Chaetomium globosum (strain ATCC 6205 / CBS 148.51 / DSM 1962 / NBRC 6347 / NRRL 1970) TaxID=306901 RepID=Q2H8D7_CHAGB|nr:uncharacterized protein CHGG_03517 [Chaetomium globosum CBS 148.51]EAQ91582.1 hypothetical protein CHGG_03517 [Chaetomium globosum CBS 148.51]